MKIKQILLLVALLSMSKLAFSDVYKCKGSEGKVVFQAHPCDNDAKPIQIQTANTDSKMSGVELPVLQLRKMNFNDSDPSSNPDLMMRQFEYASNASPQELLTFYKESPHVKSCSYNDNADNHWCKLDKHGKIHSGSVFIPTKARGGLVEVFVDYFYNK